MLEPHVKPVAPRPGGLLMLSCCGHSVTAGAYPGRRVAAPDFAAGFLRLL